MATIINTPGQGSSTNDSGAGLIIGIIIAIILIALFFMYGLPALRQGPADTNRSSNINVEVPNPVSGGSTNPQQ